MYEHSKNYAGKPPDSGQYATQATILIYHSPTTAPEYNGHRPLENYLNENKPQHYSKNLNYPHQNQYNGEASSHHKETGRILQSPAQTPPVGISVNYQNTITILIPRMGGHTVVAEL